MKTSRTYTMRTRAEKAEQTRVAVLAAAVELLERRLRDDLRLEDVADRAGVSVQTVLRIHGSKAALFGAALDELLDQMARDFARAEPGDVPVAVRTWFDHYERYGDVVVANLADERDPAVAPMVRIGRDRHRGRVEEVLGPHLALVDPTRRRRLVDALVCASDVYTWKLLRRDMKRSRADAEATMTTMIDSILGT